MTREDKIREIEAYCDKRASCKEAIDPCILYDVCADETSWWTASEDTLNEALRILTLRESLELIVRYFDNSLPEIGHVEGKKSDMIDLYSRVSMFIVEGSPAMIPLNVAMKLPDGYEAHVYPRSSTFKNTGLIQTNGVGIIDESYCGDADEWRFPCYLMPGCGKQWAYKDSEGLHVVSDRKDIPEGEAAIRGTWISAGDRLCQFRLMEHMPNTVLTTVPHLDGESRGGFGTTGR